MAGPEIIYASFVCEKDEPRPQESGKGTESTVEGYGISSSLRLTAIKRDKHRPDPAMQGGRGINRHLHIA
jgi:hypothetical protein